MVEIGMLRHFIAVAELGSFTRASERLHVSQPVISRSIKRLEAAVGAALVERTTRQVKLTPAGESYQREARALVDRLAVATENARRIGLGEAASLRVGVCPSTEAVRIAEGLQAFRERWPKLEVQLTPIFTSAQPAALRAAELDIGVMRLGAGARPDVECRVIARDPLMVAAPSVWRLGRRRTRLEALRERPWIFPDPQVAPDYHEHLRQLCRSAGFEPRIAALVGDSVTSDLLLACGVGAAFSPGRAAPRPGDGCDLLRLDLDEPQILETVVAWSPGSNSPQIQDFVEGIVTSMGPSRLSPHASAALPTSR